MEFDMTLNIAHIGLLSPIKGVEIINRLSNDPDINKYDIKWYVIGSLELYGDQYKLDWSNVTITGDYHGFKQLKKYVNTFDIDLVVSLSVAPESFSYTLSETWKLGLPVLGSSRGAIGQRIHDNNGGWTVNPDDYDEIKKILLTLIINPNIIYNKLAKIHNIKVPALNDVLNKYEEIYKEELKCLG